MRVAPEGTTDRDGRQFWNAGTVGCCNLYGSDVDDSAYLAGLITEIGQKAIFGSSPGS